MARATNSFPVPDSPVIKTVLALRAARDEVEHLPHRARGSDDPRGRGGHLAAELRSLALRRAVFQSLFDCAQQFVYLEGLGEVLKRAVDDAA
jgi:hypothetical protein